MTSRPTRTREQQFQWLSSWPDAQNGFYFANVIMPGDILLLAREPVQGFAKISPDSPDLQDAITFEQAPTDSCGHYRWQ